MSKCEHDAAHWRSADMTTVFGNLVIRRDECAVGRHVRPAEIGSSLVFERERDACAKRGDFAVLHSHVHFGDLGYTQITE
jgi:hypothetical protein